ncbi:MAG: cobyric acid synthase [Atopobiaceae bacterium]|nr:cobyric acid synthase [Atopobiaceae bacterium]
MGAKAIMIQGTMSGAGKSLLVAGLCRVLAQDGMRVAPFKSQNMALNSAITREGLEMGRAQAMQAEAAGIEPLAAMNPILLKPTSDTGSQVIVCGKPVATMPAREYFAFKRTLKDRIMSAYRELANEFDVIVIEGAGSPVEFNLKRDDIVNMGMAKMASSPVMLVGDIDRGGVFAQLVGTMALLDEDERAMVKATVVNKFRGDPTLFDEGLEILQTKCGVPVAGLIPYLDVDLDDEDSMSERLGQRQRGALLDVAVIRLPKISNFTDFIALDAMDGVSVRYVGSASELGVPDLLIIPGTKATMADLSWLRSRGLDISVRRLAEAGDPVMGICGGYQMLGEQILDPLGVEGGGQVEGLGLLPVRTEFGEQKRTVLVEGTFDEVSGPLSSLSGQPVCGYEIHMGHTEVLGRPLVSIADGGGQKTCDGCQEGSVYGCYLHGLFDRPEVTRAVMGALLARKGLDAASVQAIDMVAYRQRQYDILADGIRAHMDMRLVHRIIEEGL